MRCNVVIPERSDFDRPYRKHKYLDGHKYHPAGQFPFASGGRMFPPLIFIKSFLVNFFIIKIYIDL